MVAAIAERLGAEAVLRVVVRDGQVQVPVACQVLGVVEDVGAVARAHAGVDDEGGAVADDDADVGHGRDALVGDDEDAVGDLAGLALHEGCRDGAEVRHGHGKGSDLGTAYWVDVVMGRWRGWFGTTHPAAVGCGCRPVSWAERSHRRRARSRSRAWARAEFLVFEAVEVGAVDRLRVGDGGQVQQGLGALLGGGQHGPAQRRVHDEPEAGRCRGRRQWRPLQGGSTTVVTPVPCARLASSWVNRTVASLEVA